MDTDLFRAFVTVADSGGFSLAGKILNRTQSAVSLQIKRLEDRMEVQLFLRTSRSVALTEHGRRLLPYARNILKMTDEASRAMATAPRGETIRLGISEEQASAYLPELLPRYASDFPDTRLEIICATSLTLMAQLEDGSLDVVLAVRHLPSSTGRLIGREQLVWVAADSIVASNAAVPATSASGAPDSPLAPPLPLALNPEGCVFRAHAVAALGQERIPWIAHYTSQSPTGINLPVQAGLALTVKTPRSIPDGCNVVPDAMGLPALGTVEIELHRTPGRSGPAIDALCRRLEQTVVESDTVSGFQTFIPQSATPI
ncbi:LysR family transcriptional regulator [Fodinicurvata sp. EGI_FJ10296]|uniref:LysR family transcriptional regulator n=1 Tax=Fodinicurvata sp. EGI_FJ10296 TaxID=3231908 RepID=UPI0034529116